MDTEDRAAFIEKLTHNHDLITTKNIFFDRDRQMDISVLLNVLYDINQKDSKYVFTAESLAQPHDRFGNNLLHVAEALGYASVAKLLIQYAPDLMHETNQWGQYSMHFATMHEDALRKYPIELLDCVCKRQQTLLHTATSMGTLSNVRWLLEHSSLMEQRHSYGGFPLHITLNLFNTEPHIRAKKVMIAQTLMQHLGHARIKKQFQVDCAFIMTPKDFMEETFSAKEMDFLRQALP